jgi:hypothetical protein
MRFLALLPLSFALVSAPVAAQREAPPTARRIQVQPGPPPAPRGRIVAPARLSPTQLIQLTGGADGSVYARFTVNRPFAPGRGHISFGSPKDVWPGELPALNVAHFNAAASVDNIGVQESALYTHLNLTSSGTYLVDCSVSGGGSSTVFRFKPGFGMAQPYGANQLVNGHVTALLMVSSPGWTSFALWANSDWTFHSCEVRKI